MYIPGLRTMYLAGLLPAACITIIIASLLVHGIRRDRPSFMMPWMVCVMLSVVLGVGSAILSLVFNHGSGGVMAVVGGVVGIAFKLYCLNCVYSHYEKLEVRTMKVIFGLCAFST